MLLALLVLAAPARAQTADGDAARLNEIIRVAAHSSLHEHEQRDDIAALQELYDNRAGSLLWAPTGAASPQALRLLQALQDVAAEGLSAADYDADLLARRLAQLQSDGGAAAASWVDWDIALSAAALKFVRHLHYGRVEPLSAGFDLDRSRATLDLPSALEQLAGGNDFEASIAAIEPRFLHYRLLKAALAQYRQLARSDALPALPPLVGPSVKPGQPYAGAAALRWRLAMLGDLPQSAADAAIADETLDQELAAGLRLFQRRHGLDTDGILGKFTLLALNTPLALRVRQIELSLERWRWLPDFVTPPIIVNIPQFRLFALPSHEDREADMLNMEVVVGQAYKEKRTPVFVGSLQYVVFRPYWDVPYSITRKEILPAIKRDPDYLRSKHMELVRGAGDQAPVVAPTAENVALLASGQLRLRQRPGTDNALGEIKFMLPNPYNVYLHSTPARALFDRAQRAFSHGCIRVSDPAALAAYVLRNAPDEWPLERIADAMIGAPNQRVTLSQPIQVMILYGTAMATESGRVYFFDDIYGHDRDLEKLLSLQPVQ